MPAIFYKGKAMKKIMAGILFSAFATASMAQSSVSISGVFDTGYQSYNNGSVRYSRAANNLYDTSRVRLAGTEDLGGGLRTNFMLEGSMLPSSGTFGSTTTTGSTFNREAWVGISGGFGELRMGLQDVTVAQNIDVAVSQLTNFGVRGISTSSIELGVDQSSVIKYLSPTYKNFKFELGYAGNSTGSTTEANTAQVGYALRYDNGPVTLMAGGQNNQGATGVAKKDFRAIGGSYNFGPAAVGLTYGDGDNSSTTTLRSKSHVASLSVPLGQGFTARAGYVMTTDATYSSANKGNGYVAVLTKELSKRTMLYTAYNSVSNQSNSLMYMNGMTAPTTAGTDISAISVGMLHRF